MTPLRQRMLHDMQLHGLSPQTQEAYARAVRQLAAHYGKSPDQISEEELRDYFLYLKNEKKVSRSASTVALCGIKFFFEHTLQRQWKTFDLIRPAKEHKLPVVLSPTKVHRILSHLNGGIRLIIDGKQHPQTRDACLTLPGCRFPTDFVIPIDKRLWNLAVNYYKVLIERTSLVTVRCEAFMTMRPHPAREAAKAQAVVATISRKIVKELGLSGMR